MPFERVADRKIREAMARGEFDTCGGRGAIDLEDYFKLPAELRVAYSILRNAGVLPEEVEYLREVERLQREHDAAATDAERAPLAKQLAAARLRLDLAMERARRIRSTT